MAYPEQRALITRAKAVAGDFRAEQARHKVSDPAPGGYHALRLASELESLAGEFARFLDELERKGDHP